MSDVAMGRAMAFRTEEAGRMITYLDDKRNVGEENPNGPLFDF